MKKQKANPDKQILFKKLQSLILKEKKIIDELNSFFNEIKNSKDTEEKNLINSQIKSLKKTLKKINSETLDIVNSINLSRLIIHPGKAVIKNQIFPAIKKQEAPLKKIETKKNAANEKINISKLEKKTLNRMKKSKQITIQSKLKKPSKYVNLSNKIFFNFSKTVDNNKFFTRLKDDLIGANLEFTPASYISVLFFTTIVSVFISFLIFLLFLFFSLSINPPFLIMVTESFSKRFLEVFWIPFLIPVATFILLFFYPSLEKKSAESKINQELPFATIHMSAISGSMIDPTKIFSIIISTGEYPNLTKEFTKLLNEINIYGYNLEGALRSVASKTASKKLKELFTGLSTTITSGGDLPAFFEKRSQSLLFDYRIEREAYTKTAETFMDIYISVVIAAPMIFMLLLMMMKISGFGVSLSLNMISLLMILCVSFINIIFLIFLHLKQPAQ